MKPSIGPGKATRVTDSGAVSRVKVFFHLTTDKFIYLNPKLYVLAFLELRQNDDMLDKAGLPPLPPTDRSQFRARCFRQSSTRISAALAKATVMRITGTPSLPAPTFLSHINLARNCPGPADALPRRAPLRRRPGPSTGLLHPFTPSTPILSPLVMLRA